MRKEFEILEPNGNSVKLSIKNIQAEDAEEADKIYASKVASLIRETGSKRLLLRSQVEDFLKESGAWTEEDEKKINSLRKNIDEKLKKLKKGGLKASEGRKICTEILDDRVAIVKISTKRQMLDNATIESVADEERMDYLIYACTVYSESGLNYWESFEDLKNDKRSNAYRSAHGQFMISFYDIDPEFEKNLPENKWLKKYGFINDDLHYVDRKTGNRVDRDGNPIKQLEEELQEEVESLRGDIVEEVPFLDDETGEPIVFESKEEKSEV